LIKPTIGRVVWFHPTWHHSQPYAALITFVNSDTSVNLAVFDPDGLGHSEQDVTLRQENEAPPENQFYCEWMPYQIGQAKKTE